MLCLTPQVQGDAVYQSGAFWTADDNLSQATAASVAAGSNDVTAFSWFVNQGGGGVAGIAWVGTLCMHSGYNTNLNEAYSSQAVSAFVSKFVYLLYLFVLILFIEIKYNNRM